MKNNICEILRQNAVEDCFKIKAMNSGWPIWKKEIKKLNGSEITETAILELGDHLSEIFQSTSTKGRDQSVVSGGGYAWEGLVCWYLNLCLIGTRAVAVKKISSIPTPLRDSISVNYGNFKSNTESDIIIVVFPDRPEFTTDVNVYDFRSKTGEIILPYKKGKIDLMPILNELSDTYFREFELGVIQCKTNWNDNAQIPMLWSMIYEADFPGSSKIRVGNNNYSIRDLNNFSYSFCTVPSNDLTNFKQNSTSVNRVRNLTGGNYWGHATKSGIASSLKEIFNTNFRNAFKNSLRSNLKESLKDYKKDYNYFNL